MIATYDEEPDMSIENTTPATVGRMPALYIGHGAPPLLDDPLWSGQLRTWAGDLPHPRAILMLSLIHI